MSTELVLGLNCQIVNYVNIVLTSLSTLASFLHIVKYITHQIEIQLIILYTWQILLYGGEIFSQNFSDEGERQTFHVIKVSRDGEQAEGGIYFPDS